MKITKTKELVIEEIEVQTGTYYFKCGDDTYNKIIIEEYNNNGINYIQENVIYSSDVRGVTIKQDIIFDEIGLPYKFSAFIREVSGKKIEKEEFEQQKQEVIKRIS